MSHPSPPKEKKDEERGGDDDNNDELFLEKIVEQRIIIAAATAAAAARSSRGCQSVEVGQQQEQQQQQQQQQQEEESILKKDNKNNNNKKNSRDVISATLSPTTSSNIISTTTSQASAPARPAETIPSVRDPLEVAKLKSKSKRKKKKDTASMSNSKEQKKKKKDKRKKKHKKKIATDGKSIDHVPSTSSGREETDKSTNDIAQRMHVRSDRVNNSNISSLREQGTDKHKGPAFTELEHVEKDDGSFSFEEVVEKRIAIARWSVIGENATSSTENPAQPISTQHAAMTNMSTEATTCCTTNDTTIVPGAVWVKSINATSRQQQEEEDDTETTNYSNEVIARHDQTETTVESTEDSSMIYEARFLATTSSNAIMPMATQVDEESGAMLPLPHAVNIDPEAKRAPIYENRFRLYSFLSFSVIIALAIGAAVGVTTTSSHNDSTGPFTGTAAPITYRESLGIRAEVEQVVGRDALTDPISPYSKALGWILYDDPSQLTPDTPNFIQRYMLAYFYFSTTKDGPWRSCNPPQDPWSGETICTWEKLIDTRAYNKYENIYPSTAWLSNSSECMWAGITCDRLGQVKYVNMAGFGMSGTFPEGIFNLPLLQILVMSEGSLKGPLPSQLGTMSHLINLSLVHNQFSGSIPKEWWKASNLRNFNIGNNTITGTISPEIANLRDLLYLRLEHNRLRGSVPTEIGLLDNIIALDLSSNELTGDIPSTIGTMNRLKVLKLHSNGLTGHIPLSVGNLSSLIELRLNNNPSLSGTIPDSLYKMSRLLVLDLNDCDLRGTLSPEIGNMKNLETLRISNNNLHGTIPFDLPFLDKLQRIWLHGNDFEGDVPGIFWSDGSTRQWHGEEFTADCAPDDVDGKIELRCSCCTVCCSPEGTDCLPTS